MDNVRIYKQVIYDIYDNIDEKQKEIFNDTFQEIRHNIKALGDNIESDSGKVLEKDVVNINMNVKNMMNLKQKE